MSVALVSADHRTRLELVRALEAAPAEWDISLHHSLPATADVVVCDPELSIEGALRFDPSAPERLVEAIMTAARRDPGAVVVTGAGGGTGATSVALHMAAELVTRGFTTALVDMSDDGDAGARLGAGDGGRDAGSSERVVPVPGGFRLVSTDEPDLERAIERARDRFDRVVVDVSAHGLHELPPGSTAVIVIRPSPCGVRRARALVEAHAGLAWLPVVNRLGAGGEMTAATIGRLLGIPVAVELQCCPALRDREDECRLLKPGWTRFTRRIARIVDLAEP